MTQLISNPLRKDNQQIYFYFVLQLRDGFHKMHFIFILLSCHPKFIALSLRWKFLSLIYCNSMVPLDFELESCGALPPKPHHIHQKFSNLLYLLPFQP